MARLSIPKAPAAKPKTVKVKDFSMPGRNPGGIPSLKRSITSKSKSTYTPIPKDVFGKMQPSMQTAFQVLGTADLINQDFMKQPILMPPTSSARTRMTEKELKKNTEPLLSELL